jgi:Rps23 Pro-64 3,4-dihydroxylase Tpa1-like proline 4-hydroxylase
MINHEIVNNTQNDQKKFLEAQPFNHLILDNFIEDQDFINKVFGEVTQIPNDQFDFNEHHEVQIKKRGLSQLDRMPENTKKLVEFFQSSEMIHYLESITGIKGLLADGELLGGGLHKMDRGGHLAVHADFNIHINTGHHRRINALLYLNPNWESEWGGQLELWDGAMSRCWNKVEPILNRLVVFRITDDALHGHPDPMMSPEGISRYSLAFYYYTQDRPEDEKSPFHWALWQRRPDGRF